MECCLLIIFSQSRDDGLFLADCNVLIDLAIVNDFRFLVRQCPSFRRKNQAPRTRQRCSDTACVVYRWSVSGEHWCPGIAGGFSASSRQPSSIWSMNDYSLMDAVGIDVPPCFIVVCNNAYISGCQWSRPLYIIKSIFNWKWIKTLCG